LKTTVSWLPIYSIISNRGAMYWTSHRMA